MLVLRSNWTCRIWFGILSSRAFCIVVSDFAYLLPFSNNFPLKFLKNTHSGFTLIHIPNNSACSIDVGLWLKLLKVIKREYTSRAPVSSETSGWLEIFIVYRMSGFFLVGLIFAECVTSLKLQKIDTAKNKPYQKSSLGVLEIAKIGLSENLTHLPGVIFAKISRREKFQTHSIWTLRFWIMWM